MPSKAAMRFQSGKDVASEQFGEAYVFVRRRHGHPEAYVGDVPVSRIVFWVTRGASIDKIVQRYVGRITHHHVSAAMAYNAASAASRIGHG
jgi:uncharacterized protein (DUF433 family)